jgi:hypothetical protein
MGSLAQWCLSQSRREVQPHNSREPLDWTLPIGAIHVVDNVYALSLSRAELGDPRRGDIIAMQDEFTEEWLLPFSRNGKRF